MKDHSVDGSSILIGIILSWFPTAILGIIYDPHASYGIVLFWTLVGGIIGSILGYMFDMVFL